MRLPRALALAVNCGKFPTRRPRYKLYELIIHTIDCIVNVNQMLLYLNENCFIVLPDISYIHHLDLLLESKAEAYY